MCLRNVVRRSTANINQRRGSTLDDFSPCETSSLESVFAIKIHLLLFILLRIGLALSSTDVRYNWGENFVKAGQRLTKPLLSCCSIFKREAGLNVLMRQDQRILAQVGAHLLFCPKQHLMDETRPRKRATGRLLPFLQHVPCKGPAPLVVTSGASHHARRGQRM